MILVNAHRTTCRSSSTRPPASTARGSWRDPRADPRAADRARRCVTAFVFGFITAWNEFLFGLMLTTRDAVPMTVGASFFFASAGGGVQWGLAAAVMIVAALPPMLLGLLDVPPRSAARCWRARSRADRRAIKLRVLEMTYKSID